MRLASWLRPLARRLAHFTASPRTARPSRRPRRAPAVRRLEDRTVPSAVVPAFGQVREFAVPPVTGQVQPDSASIDPQGNVWFCNYNSPDAGYVTPGGTMVRLRTPEPTAGFQWVPNGFPASSSGGSFVADRMCWTSGPGAVGGGN